MKAPSPLLPRFFDCVLPRFFDCVSSGQYDGCYDACEAASLTDVERFLRCTETGICDDASCLARLDPDLGPAAIGESCSSAADCAEPGFPEDAACIAYGSSTNYCTYSCDYGADICPAGFRCVETDWPDEFCVPL